MSSASQHRQHLAGYLDRHKNRQAEAGNNDRKQQKAPTTAPGRRSFGGSSASLTSSLQSKASYLTRRKVPTKISGKANIDHLPDEIILEIFSYLKPQELLSAARVCKRWLPLANDNLLWNAIFEKYAKFSVEPGNTNTDRPPPAHWKTLCIQRCAERRNKKALRLLKKTPHPFTGLPRDTEKALKSAGVHFQLSLVNHNQDEYTLQSRDVFWHSMSVGVRWYDLQMPSPRQVHQIKIYSCNPLFFKPDGTAADNSPYQRSLLKTVDINLDKWIKTNKPQGSEDLVSLYVVPHGLMFATYKDGGDLAFIVVGLHQNQLVKMCLLGNPLQPFENVEHKPIPDDVDSSYGLHGYSCTVELRTLRQSVWSQQFTYLNCKQESVGSGYSVFSLIRKDNPTDHVVLNKKLQFPWKTDAFKGTVPNVLWLDVTVVDERKEPFWCKSSGVKLSGSHMQDNFNFEFTNQEVFSISHMDETGKVSMELSQTDHSEFFITRLDIMLSLTSINKWFATNYR